MQFEDFDKKIKEAAEHHHPAYEEKAWKKMEKLLDKHMPVEKDDKRRFLFLLLLLFIVGAGIFLWIAKPGKPQLVIMDKAAASAPLNNTEKLNTSEVKTVPEKHKTGDGEVATAADNSTTSLKATNPEKKKLKANDSPVEQAESRSAGKINSAITAFKVKNNSGTAQKERGIFLNNDHKAKRIVPTKNNASLSKNLDSDTKDRNITATADAGTTQGVGNNPVTDAQTNEPAEKSATDIPASVTTAAAADSVTKKADEIVVVEQEKKKEDAVKKINPKSGKQKRNGFAFTFSAGPDLSDVAGNKIGKMKLSYGAGLSYTINRFTLRSGFYVAKKVYAAGPDDYHPPKHYWTNYVDLAKVNADCKVYEIPVILSYHFSTTKRHNWFAAAGLSSYLMKSETYDYAYKDRATQTPGYKTWTLKNGSNHLFSIVNLSAGYERIINKTLSITAEPYLKIPTNGIGFGSVNLNSAGVLFTLNVKPFGTNR